TRNWYRVADSDAARKPNRLAQWGTQGNASFIGFDPKTRVGVVVLSNASIVSGNNFGVNDSGLHLLNARYPLGDSEPAKDRKQVAVDPEILGRYVGRYELSPSVVLTITHQDSRLFAQATDQPKIEIFPESQREFF